jgi:hypothetical protein
VYDMAQFIKEKFCSPKRYRLTDSSMKPSKENSNFTIPYSVEVLLLCDFNYNILLKRIQPNVKSSTALTSSMYILN